MPELPEVETTVKGINEKAIGAVIVSAWTDFEKNIKRPKRFGDFLNEIKGKKIIKAWRRAKNIVIDLSGGYSLLVHQKMTGHLLYGKWEEKNSKWSAINNPVMSEPVNNYIHFILFFDNGNMLALSDLRKFAKIELWKKEELLEDFKNIGPEPLWPDFTLDRFKAIIKNKKGKIKQVLMNPEVIAGIGNIYSDEALWWSKIHPLRATASLSDSELKELYLAIKKVLFAGIKLGGESFADYRNIDGKKGEFDDERKAYQREGEKCERCLIVIKRIKVGGRSACFCPSCQKE